MRKLSTTDLRYADAIARTLATRTLDDLVRFANTIADQALRIEGNSETKPLSALLLGLMLERKEFDRCLEQAMALRAQIEGMKRAAIN